MAVVGLTRRRGGRAATSSSLYAYRYISPAMLALLIASFVPIVFTVFISLTSWDAFHNPLVEGFHFVGLRNYKLIIDSASSEFLVVFVWTIVFAALSTVINFFVGLFLAFLLNNPHMWERNVYRTILILPWALPGTLMLLVWYGLLQTQGGQINSVISSIHIGSFNPGNIPFLDDGNWAKFSVILVNTWLGFPFMMAACLGALQSIPSDVQDAAQVDGAGVWTRFWRIIFPLLRSATLPLIISTFAFNLNNFGAVYFLTGGGPQTNLTSNAGATDILPTYAYNLAGSHQLYALAGAYSVVIFVIIGSLSLMNMKFSRVFEEVER
jgi:arabinogalactan oligomer / maltooligosaccharide transport system permease protein